VDLTPLEQLAAVLPQSSFHLLPPELQTLDAVYPHAWPTDWGMYSFGRRFMWECEPLIPLVQPAQIKTWIETMYE
jgi:5'-3' exonuclease